MMFALGLYCGMNIVGSLWYVHDHIEHHHRWDVSMESQVWPTLLMLVAGVPLITVIVLLAFLEQLKRSR